MGAQEKEIENTPYFFQKKKSENLTSIRRLGHLSMVVRDALQELEKVARLSGR